jgi:hypothetical protein
LFWRVPLYGSSWSDSGERLKLHYSPDDAHFHHKATTEHFDNQSGFRCVLANACYCDTYSLEEEIDKADTLGEVNWEYHPLGGYHYLYAPEDLQHLCDIRYTWMYEIKEVQIFDLSKTAKKLAAITKAMPNSLEFQKRYIEEALCQLSFLKANNPSDKFAAFQADPEAARQTLELLHNRTAGSMANLQTLRKRLYSGKLLSVQELNSVSEG